LKKTRDSEFYKFDRTMHELIKVPHSAIKAALDEERAAKVRAGKQKAKGKKREKA
jgi:hypothetical protein